MHGDVFTSLLYVTVLVTPHPRLSYFSAPCLCPLLSFYIRSTDHVSVILGFPHSYGTGESPLNGLQRLYGRNSDSLHSLTPCHCGPALLCPKPPPPPRSLLPQSQTCEAPSLLCAFSGMSSFSLPGQRRLGLHSLQVTSSAKTF